MMKVEPPPNTTTLTTCPQIYMFLVLNHTALIILPIQTRNPNPIAQRPAVIASTIRPKLLAGLKNTAEVAVKWPDMPMYGRKKGMKDTRHAQR
jgi:hypothetical protein